jgi:serine phosphatase RsbU (regulator of sigma subunit)
MINQKILELERALQETQEEKRQIDLLNELSWSLRDIDLRRAIQLAQHANRLSVRLSDGSIYDFGLAWSSMHLGFYHFLLAQYEDAISRLSQAKRLFQSINHSDGLALTLSRLALTYWHTGEYEKALAYVLEAMHSCENKHNLSYAWASYVLAGFYLELKEPRLSMTYYEKALSIFEQHQETGSAARCYNGLGRLSQREGDIINALHMQNQAIRLQQKIGDQSGYARSLHDIAYILMQQKQYEKALQHAQESLSIRQKLGAKGSIINSKLQIAWLFYHKKLYDKALKEGLHALEIASNIQAKPKLYRIHELLAQVYKAIDDSKKALYHLEQYIQLKEEVIGEDANTRLKRLQISFAIERAEHETEMYRLNNIKLREAYEEIQIKNKQITESIQYAHHLQEALLADSKLLRSAFPQSFVIYLPKDIVSGDFYWMSLVPSLFPQTGSEVLLAAGDCTGHGVPGALMTVLCLSMLNQIVQESKICAPAQILNVLDFHLQRTINRQGKRLQNQSADMAVCRLNLKEKKLLFAGAHMDLILIRDQQIQTLRGSRFPVGFPHGKRSFSFTETSIELKKGDMLYLFTDGFADQFGISENRKFMLKRFRHLLLKIADLPIQEQEQLLLSNFHEWKDSLEQTDDVLVIGIRI